MALFKRRAAAPPTAKTPEHAVIVHFALTGGDYGTEAQREAVFALEDQLIRAIDAAGVGEFDSNEFGGGEAVLYAYGAAPEILFLLMTQSRRDHRRGAWGTGPAVRASLGVACRATIPTGSAGSRFGSRDRRRALSARSD
jgi:hypothetical protein